MTSITTANTTILGRVGGKRVAAAFLLSATVVSSGCTTNAVTGGQQVSRAAIGVGGGAALGALAGAAVGGSDRAQRNAVLIGAGLGALAGGAAGAYMDQQEAALRAELEATGVGIRRAGDEIVLVMPSNITFRTDSATIDPGFTRVLTNVSTVLKRYDRSLIDVYGHTDNTGGTAYNQQLSEQRARSVANFLAARGVRPDRMAVTGFGESRPVTSNASPQGREQNRRVEIRLVPLTA